MRPPDTYLLLILALFVLLGAAYSVVVPPFEASDELWHYPMVQFIATHWALPVQDPANVGPWRQEGSQPPLYYALAAAITSWIDTSDMPQVRYLNPQADLGVATPDGNVNLVVHDPAREAFPWRGTVLAVHLIRLLSVGMGAAAVYLTYRLVRTLFPHHPTLALGAAAIHAFTPMFIFISGSVNNDNLVVPLCSMALLGMMRPSFRIRDALFLGLLVGLAALTKESALGLLPLALLAVAVRGWAQAPGARMSQRILAVLRLSLGVLLPVLAVAGWWYLRNLHLYGDLLGWSAFIEILGQRDVPADLAQLWRERYSFLAGYWGNFGGLNVPMPPWAYTLLNGLLVVAVAGLAIGLLRKRMPKPAGGVQGAFSLLILLLWAGAVVFGWFRWAQVTWSSQGRLVFPAIPVWSLGLALGLAGWLPHRWEGWPLATCALLLLGLSTAALPAWIAPAYAPPAPLSDEEVAAIPHPLQADFGGVMRLLGYDLETGAAGPGSEVAVTLYWEALAPAGQETAVFVHLLGLEERLVAQRDTLPGLGRLSATRLTPGFRWADRTVLRLPATAYAPDVTQVEVGLYDPVSGVRLPLADGGDSLRFGRVELRPRPDDVPNPITLDFGGQMALVGYDLSALAVRPGETVTLTLYWRGERPMDTNYTVSAQLVDDAQRKAAQHDSWPLEGAAPTASWQTGQQVVEQRALTVYPDAPPGSYDLRVTVYVLRGEEIVRLPLISATGAQLEDHVVLTRVRVR